MTGPLRRAIWRLAAFVSVCLCGIFIMLAVFAQLRFDRQTSYDAVFTNVSGLSSGNFVRVAGVEVGKVRDIWINADSTVTVSFAVDDSMVLTEGTKAVIRYDNVYGGRYLALLEGPGNAQLLKPGQTIPLERTRPALDLDALIGGFRPLFRALEPDQVNSLSAELIRAFQGQGDTIKSFLSHTATFTATLADRDQLIGEVIDNLNVVVGTLADENGRFEEAIDSLAQLMHGLAKSRSDIANGIAHADEAAATLADLLAAVRPPLQETVAQTDRAAAIVVADHEYFDNLLRTLPEKYRILARQGIYGDYFTFYLCDMVLKVNGKGGQPVYVKIAGQDTGRCAPR